MGLRTERTRVVCAYCFDHWVPKRRCDVCGREYATFSRAWKHIFCSRRCEKLHYGRGEEKFVLPRRICVGCGEEFQPTRIDQYHHSNGGICRMRARRKRQRLKTH
jgi:hypothetical protein